MGSTIDYRNGLSGYLTEAQDGHKRAGVVVLQEWWGLVPHIKRVADRFAAAGYTALAPDLYHGKVATEPDEARKLVMALQQDQAVAAIVAAGHYLKSLPAIDAVGVVGFCMGGAATWWTAMSDAGAELFAAGVAFYGGPPPPEQASQVGMPVLGLYGAEDQGIPVDRVQNFAAAVDSSLCDFYIYPNAPHAFFNDTRPSYRAEAADDAWRRTVAWWERFLA